MGILYSKQSQLVDVDWLTASDRKTYDVVIVGGGTAGCVLANRLSEDPRITVLLIEAGASHESELYSKLPIAWTKNLWSPIDWQFYTTPQENLNGRQLFWPRGKVLGGSSSINAMMYHHCAPSDFDEWAALSATGFSYADMQPAFRRAEKFTPHVLHADVDSAHRGTEGFWHTGYAYSSPVCQAFVQAAENVGIPRNADINTPNGTIGVATIATFVDQTGARSSAATAYLSKDVLARLNLTVVTSARVVQVILSADNKRAIGVELVNETNPTQRTSVYASKEVILSAGAIGTPQLLMLSGIGPKKHLEEMGIVVKHDMPAVGQNLKDHPTCVVHFRAKLGMTLDYIANPIRSLPVLAMWLTGFKGPMTSNGAEAAAFVRTDDPKLGLKEPGKDYGTDPTSGPEAPDVELIAVPAAFINHASSKVPAGSNAFGIAPVVLRPESVGSITLKSTNPFDKPIIEANYLSSRKDVDTFIRGIRLALRIGHSAPLCDSFLQLKSGADPNDTSTYESTIFNIGDSNESELTDEVIEQWLKRNVETLYHPVSTARIGASIQDSVVDASLKVHGIEGLRIMDASTFPMLISGHTCAPVIAMAERASDIIKQSLSPGV